MSKRRSLKNKVVSVLFALLVLCTVSGVTYGLKEQNLVIQKTNQSIVLSNRHHHTTSAQNKVIISGQKENATGQAIIAKGQAIIEQGQTIIEQDHAATSAQIAAFTALQQQFNSFYAKVPAFVVAVQQGQTALVNAINTENATLAADTTYIKALCAQANVKCP